MKLLRWSLLLVIIALVGVASAWDKDDHEIFDLVAGLEAAEGKITFYDFLNVSKSATEPEISRAYRKRSLELHPDKNRGVKNAQSRFQRLGVIAQILRSSEKRSRYDFFLKNGVPRWKGTGYLYSRYRPGLGAVMVFLTLLTSGVQYIVMQMNAKTKRAKITQLIQRAKAKAYGTKGAPIVGQERKKIKMSPKAYPSAQDDDGDDESSASSGKLTFIVEGTKVYVLDDGYEELLDESVVPTPTVADAWPIALIRALFARLLGRSGASNSMHEVESESEPTGMLSKSARTNGAASSTSIGKVAGRRRKQNKR